MDDQSVYINQLQEDLEAKIEQIEKLEGWLKYLWKNYLSMCYRYSSVELEISDYIKAMEARERLNGRKG